MKNKCPICKELIKGRSDKRFCCNQCKNEYHIRLRQVTRIATIDTDRILHRNRSILLEIMGKVSQKKKIARDVLDQKQFNFDYITGYYINKQGKTYHYVYDFAWMLFSDREILIIRRKQSA